PAGRLTPEAGRSPMEATIDRLGGASVDSGGLGSVDCRDDPGPSRTQPPHSKRTAESAATVRLVNLRTPPPMGLAASAQAACRYSATSRPASSRSTASNFLFRPNQ